MIYFVDEDFYDMEPYQIQLKTRGYDALILQDADEAFETLLNADDIEAVVLDVMLATAEEGVSRFNAANTAKFTITGISLLDDLVEQFKGKKDDTIPKKVILFSAAQRNWIVHKIEKKASDYDILYFDKKEYTDTYFFSEKLIEIINKWKEE